jgi:apolipoprotein N-acyltransferase
MELILPLLVSSLAALAIAEYHVLPQWWYKTWLAKHKPFSCVTCLSFWIGFTVGITVFDFNAVVILAAILYGLASAGLTVVILQLTNR